MLGIPIFAVTLCGFCLSSYVYMTGRRGFLVIQVWDMKFMLFIQ